MDQLCGIKQRPKKHNLIFLIFLKSLLQQFLTNIFMGQKNMSHILFRNCISSKNSFVGSFMIVFLKRNKSACISIYIFSSADVVVLIPFSSSQLSSVGCNSTRAEQSVYKRLVNESVEELLLNHIAL